MPLKFLLLCLLIFVSACGSPASSQVVQPPDAMAEAVPPEPGDEKAAIAQEEASEVMAKPEEAMAEAGSTEAKTAESPAMAEKEPAAETTAPEAMPAENDVPAWFQAELIDVNTGETFKMADFQGKVVLIETMAVWCPLCLRQQNQVKALHERIGERDDLVSVALDIDPNETPEILKAYTGKQGFDWVYAVAPPEVAREIGQRYGAQFLNPPSTPMLIIDRQGQVHPLPFGHKESTTLQEALIPFLDES